MADELRFTVSADGADAAAKEVAKVQDAVDKLEGTAAQVSIEAEDEATDVLEGAQGAVDDLDGADATVAVDADDEATEPLEAVQGAVDELDGGGATVSVDADDQATDTLDDVSGAVADIDGETASVEIEADDKASGTLDSVTDKIGGLADAAGQLPGPLGEISGLLGQLGTTGAGATAGIAGALAGLAAFAIGGVKQFQALGIEIDNFATKTGASLDASSRFVEVAKDLDIGVANIETSLGRMNKVAGETPEAFDEIGATLVKNDQGNIDSVETFISVIDALNRMPNASARATAGNDIFGRGWQNMSELVGMSADELRARLQDVSDVKIFDDAKVGEAQGLRDAFDAIADASDDLFLAIGKSLAPAISSLAPALADAVTALEPLISAIGDGLGPVLEDITPLIQAVSDSVGAWQSIQVPDWLGSLGTAAKNAISPIDSLRSSMSGLTEHFGSDAELTGELGDKFKQLGTAEGEAGTAAADAAAAAKAYQDVLQAQADVLQEAVDAQNELSGAMSSYADLTVEIQEKSASFTETLATYNETAKDTEKTQAEVDKTLLATVKSAGALADSVVEVAVEQDNMNGTVTSATSKLDTQNQSLLASAATASGPARQSILDYTFALNQVPPDVQSEIIALINQGKLDEANALLADASKNRDATINADANQASLNQTGRQIDAVANQDRTATIDVRMRLASTIIPGLSQVLAAAGQTTSATAAAATGFGATEDDETMTVTPMANGQVRISRARGHRRATATNVTNVTNNVIVPRIPSGRELARVAQRWSRVNGKG